MRSETKNAVRLMPLLALALLTAACATPSAPSLPVVVKPAAIPPLPPELAKEPKPSGAYLKRADERRQKMLESLKD